MRKLFGPTTATVYGVPAGGTLTVYRIVRSEHVEDPPLLNSLRSNFDLRREPRRSEVASTLVHMGISVYLDRDDCVGTARRLQRLGDWTARLDLVQNMGFNYAQTAQPGHLTLWADPVKLTETVVDIEPVLP